MKSVKGVTRKREKMSIQNKKFEGLNSLKKVSKMQETGSLLKEDETNNLHPLLKKVSVIPVLVLNTKPKLFTNRVGELVGNFTIVKFLGYKKMDDSDLWWEVVCDCGSTSVVNEDFLAELLTSDLNKCIHCYGKKKKEERLPTKSNHKSNASVKKVVTPPLPEPEPIPVQETLIGKVFNNFTVIRKMEESLNGEFLYTVKCDCGKTTTMSLKALKTHLDYGRHHCGQCTGQKQIATIHESTPTRVFGRHQVLKEEYLNFYPALKMTKNEYELFFKKTRIGIQRLRKLDSWIGEEKINFRIVGFKSIGTNDNTTRVAIKCKRCEEITYVSRYVWVNFDKNDQTVCKCFREIWDSPKTKPESKVVIDQKVVIDEVKPEVKEPTNPKVEIQGKEYNHIKSAYEMADKNDSQLLDGITPNIVKDHNSKVGVDDIETTVRNSVTSEPKIKEPKKKEENLNFDIDIAVKQLIKELSDLGFKNDTLLSFILVNDFEGQFDITSYVNNSNKIVLKFKNLLDLRQSYYKLKVNYAVDKINKRILLFINCYDNSISFIDKIEIKLVPLNF